MNDLELMIAGAVLYDILRMVVIGGLLYWLIKNA
jgi:hypothetical protein